MTTVSNASRFAGVLKILRYNLRFYVFSTTVLALAAGVLLLHLLPPRLGLLAFVAALLAGFWTLSSLLVSWYVYDLIGVTRWTWMQTQLAAAPQRWVNIHAGLDESTAALKRLFPNSTGTVIDIYDPAEMTEPSIARARRITPASEPFVAGSFDHLPLRAGDRDQVFLLLAAHEVRAPAHRSRLLRETNRILKQDGQVVLVEHLRDWPNLLAFGPGALHFHSRRSWRRNIQEAGLRLEREITLTPFVHCFFLRKVGR